MMEIEDSSEKLNNQLDLIKELLQKQNVVEQLVHLQKQPRHGLVESLARRQSLAELQNQVKRLHPADVAYVLANLPLEQRLLVWKLVPITNAGDVLFEASEAIRQQLVSETSESSLIQILEHLDADDLTVLSDVLPESVLQRSLQLLDEQERQFYDTSTAYSEDSAAHLMTNFLVTVRESDTLDMVLKQLRELEVFPSHLDKLFVLDQRGVFKGVLFIQQLLRQSPQKHVSDIMAKEVVMFLPTDKARDAATAFERYDLISAPVLNERGKVIGRLTVDDLMNYQRAKASEEMLAMAGLSKQEDLFITIWDGVRNRWVWVVLNLLTAFIASRVIGLFEATIAQIVALAALMPIVASVGGNTGNQTTALVIRNMSLGAATRKNFALMIRKELGISLVNGLALGVIVGLFAFIFYQNLKLTAVIAVAMLINLLIAATVGLFAPLFLEKFGRDPALGSTIVLTATTDSLGFFIFLGLAALFLI
ncbi:MAG: magnesium transporter [Thioalkalispiraceae bacterium]|jgi:magnesium transporter